MPKVKINQNEANLMVKIAICLGIPELISIAVKIHIPSIEVERAFNINGFHITPASA
jgi:hypothetical protein